MTKVIWLRFDKEIFELNIIYFTLFMELRAKKNVIVTEQKFKNFEGTLFMCIIVSLNVSSGIKVLQEWKEKKKPSKKREKTILILTWSHDAICWRMKAYENCESFAGLILKIQWHKHKPASEFCALSSAFMCIVLNVKTFRIYYLKRKRQFLLSSYSTHRPSLYSEQYNGALSEFNHKMLHRTNSNTHENIYIYINALFEYWMVVWWKLLSDIAFDSVSKDCKSIYLMAFWNIY